jgi:phosphoglycerate dehydrogenase-like enzyme
MALALCLVRNIRPAAEDVRAGAWNWRAARPVRRCREQVFGVLGCGRIGTATALRAQAFGFGVIFFDPYLSDGVEKALGIGRVRPLEELVASADVLSLHVPLTPETHLMVGAKTVPRSSRNRCWSTPPMVSS